MMKQANSGRECPDEGTPLEPILAGRMPKSVQRFWLDNSFWFIGAPTTLIGNTLCTTWNDPRWWICSISKKKTPRRWKVLRTDAILAGPNRSFDSYGRQLPVYTCPDDHLPDILRELHKFPAVDLERKFFRIRHLNAGRTGFLLFQEADDFRFPGTLWEVWVIWYIFFKNNHFWKKGKDSVYAKWPAPYWRCPVYATYSPAVTLVYSDRGSGLQTIFFGEVM